MIALNQIERIKIKLRLAKNTDSFLEVFGASSHKYILNKPIKNQSINDFENKYNIKLPEAYKKFLTEIGNGGLEYPNTVVSNSAAGPDYGIFRLGHEHHFIVKPSLKYLERKPFFDENMKEDEWEKVYDRMDDNISDEDYDIEVAKAYSGILNIGFSGCSGYLGIILTGENKGRIVHTYDEIEYCPHFSKETNFLDWYENWLDEIISGKSISYKGLKNEKEESCVSWFLSNNESYRKLISLSYIKSFDALNGSSLKILNEKYKEEKDEKVKHYILNLLTKFDYDKTKNEITKLVQKNPMAFLRNLHLYNREKSIEWINEIDEIKRNSNDPEILEYIKYVTNVDIVTIKILQIKGNL